MGATPGSVARREIEVELKGKKYTVREPDIEELSMFESYVRSKKLQIYQDGSKGIDPDDRRKTIQSILSSPLKTEGGEAVEIQNALSSMDGARYMLYLVLRHNPGVTLEGMSAIVDLSNLATVNTILDSLGEDDADPPLIEQDSP